MHFRSQSIKKLATALFAVTLPVALVSCGGKDKDDEPEEPVKQPGAKTRSTAAVIPPVDPSDMFRTPKDDQLPTEAQLKQGAESSIGTVGTVPLVKPPAGPSTTVKPPIPAPSPEDDQLDPGE